MIGNIGGASRDRTDDLIVANDALSQLSYSPVCRLVGVLDYFISLPECAPNGSPDSVFAPSFLSVLCESSATSTVKAFIRFHEKDGEALCHPGADPATTSVLAGFEPHKSP